MEIKMFLRLKVIMFSLFLNSITLGMFQVGSLKHQLPNKKKIVTGIGFNKDLLIEIAAQDEQGIIKNNASKTCKDLNGLIRKTNPLFVGMSSFIAHPKDMNDIILFFSWNNNNRIVESLSKKIIGSQINFPFGETGGGMWSGGGFTCSWPARFDADLPGKLRLQYSNAEEKIDWDANKLPSQAEIALLFAALCGDKQTLEIIAPRLKKIYEPVGVFYRRMLQDDLIRLLIKHDDARAFELLVTYDPYNTLNEYDPNDKTGEFDKPFLNSLINIVRHNPKVKTDYVSIYKKCGGKTLEELEPTKCIIS